MVGEEAAERDFSVRCRLDRNFVHTRIQLMTLLKKYYFSNRF